MQNEFILRLKKQFLFLVASSLLLIIMFSASSCANPKSADAKINDLLNSKCFLTLPKSEQVDNTRNLLKDLVDTNLIQKDVQFNSEDLLFTFRYSDNTLGGIDLSPKASDIDNSDTYTADTNDPTGFFVNNELAYADSSQKKIHILYALDRSFKQYYIDLRQEWGSIGLDVSIDYQVTVQDLTKLSCYDTLIFSMHGITYETRPVICLLEEENQYKRSIYQEFLNNGLIAGVYNSSGGMYRKCYWIFPEFFGCVYENDELSNTCVLAECCEFLGFDGKSNTKLDCSFPNNFSHAGAACTFGFRNSPPSYYSMKMITGIVDDMTYEHHTVGKSFEQSKTQYKANNIQFYDTDYVAVPYLFGDTNFSLSDEY